MFDGGRRLKLARLDCSLTYRDVEHLSRILSERYADERYTVRLSVLANIENQGTAPTIFRLHSLCLIYGLAMPRVLTWFGVWPKTSERTFVEGYVESRPRPTETFLRAMRREKNASERYGNRRRGIPRNVSDRPFSWVLDS